MRVHKSTTRTKERFATSWIHPGPFGNTPNASERSRDSGARHRPVENETEAEAATTARRAFVAELVGRRRAPEGMMAYALEDMASYPSDETALADDVVAQIVPVEPEHLSVEKSWTGSVTKAVDARLPNLLFALVAGAIESRWNRLTWHQRDPRNIAYLRFLADQGYALARIERRMVQSSASPPRPESATAHHGV